MWCLYLPFSFVCLLVGATLAARAFFHTSQNYLHLGMFLLIFGFMVMRKYLKRAKTKIPLHLCICSTFAVLGFFQHFWTPMNL